jgi:orotidine-5'-phosphate decarboxylase
MNDINDAVRNRLAIALDVPDLDTAEALAKEVAPWIGIAKVGLELFSAAGPDAISRFVGLDLRVFADLKLHDIPTTVGRAARVLGGLGANYVNFHAAGGVDMLRAATEGLTEGAQAAGRERPVPIAVTVLTSDPDASAFDARLQAAIAGGCGGVVCSMHEVERVHAARPDFLTIVPGVRFDEGAQHDQARIGNPFDAARAGSDILVIGRAVTAAEDRRLAAERVHDAVARAYASSEAARSPRR